jgi:DNA-binding transcriptional LysR family regulator
VLLGNTWIFENGPSTMSVEVRSKLHVNDTRVLTDATRKGIGLAILPRFLAREDLKSGRLVEVMKSHPVPTFWMKAQVPRIKMGKPAVSQLVEYLKSRMQPAPPWELPAA